MRGSHFVQDEMGLIEAILRPGGAIRGERREMVDDFAVYAFERARQTGTEERINDNIVAPPPACDVFPRRDLAAPA